MHYVIFVNYIMHCTLKIIKNKNKKWKKLNIAHFVYLHVIFLPVKNVVNESDGVDDYSSRFEEYELVRESRWLEWEPRKRIVNCCRVVYPTRASGDVRARRSEKKRQNKKEENKDWKIVASVDEYVISGEQFFIFDA